MLVAINVHGAHSNHHKLASCLALLKVRIAANDEDQINPHQKRKKSLDIILRHVSLFPSAPATLVIRCNLKSIVNWFFPRLTTAHSISRSCADAFLR